MKRNPETKGGIGPAANVSFNPERGYGTSEQKEKIEQAEKSGGRKNSIQPNNIKAEKQSIDDEEW